MIPPDPRFNYPTESPRKPSAEDAIIALAAFVLVMVVFGLLLLVLYAFS